eukprot:12932269-Prorocentrum_lima.AAC.1
MYHAPRAACLEGPPCVAGYVPARCTFAPSVWGCCPGGRRLIAQQQLDRLPAPSVVCRLFLPAMGQTPFTLADNLRD